ncbi:hypothetical protein AKO1_005382, partial [Acrasis kona]
KNITVTESKNHMNENIFQADPNSHFIHRSAQKPGEILRNVPTKTPIQSTPQRKVLTDITNQSSTTRILQSKSSDKKLLGKRSSSTFEIYADDDDKEKPRQKRKTISTENRHPDSFYEEEIEHMPTFKPITLPPVSLEHWDDNNGMIDVVVCVEKNLHKIKPMPTSMTCVAKRTFTKQKSKSALKPMHTLEVEDIVLESVELQPAIVTPISLPSFDWDNM